MMRVHGWWRLIQRTQERTLASLMEMIVNVAVPCKGRPVPVRRRQTPVSVSSSIPSRGTAAPTREGATRRRGLALEQAIYDAVFELLGTVGYGRLTMEGVAARARTGKASLYRRWNDKDALIVDALRASLPSADVPAQATVRADLLELLRRIRDALEFSYGAAFQALKAEAGPGAELVHAAIRERVFAPYRQLTLAALRRGVERGEVRADAVSDIVATVGPAMLVHHNFIDG